MLSNYTGTVLFLNQLEGMKKMYKRWRNEFSAMFRRKAFIFYWITDDMEVQTIDRVYNSLPKL